MSAENKLDEKPLAASFDELAKVRETLNSRYDDLKTGRVQPIPGDQATPAYATEALRTVSAKHRPPPQVFVNCEPDSRSEAGQSGICRTTGRK